MERKVLFKKKFYQVWRDEFILAELSLECKDENDNQAHTEFVKIVKGDILNQDFMYSKNHKEIVYTLEKVDFNFFDNLDFSDFEEDGTERLDEIKIIIE